MARIENVNIDGTDYDVGKIASASNLGVVQVGDGLSITSAGVLSASSSGGDKTFFGRCSTASGTADKVVSIYSGGTFTDDNLVNGTHLIVAFTNMNEASNARLVVEGGTPKMVGLNGLSTNSGEWRGNSTVEFVYGNGYWLVSSFGQAGETIRGIVKLSDSTSSTGTANQGTAATPSAVKSAYDLAKSKVSITLSTTDIGQGASLAANTLYGVYE